jgi:hypothetical protein
MELPIVLARPMAGEPPPAVARAHRGARPQLLVNALVGLCLALPGLGAAASAAATELSQRALALPPSRTVQLDGRLDEAFWADAPVADGFGQFLPQPGPLADPSYRTEVRVVVTDTALVVGIRAHDPRPAEIRAPLVRRDQVQRDQDFVSVFVDTAGERRAAQFVRVNPRGVLTDGLFIADRTAQVEGNDGDEDFSPDFEVEAAAHLDESGYSVELRIPFEALRLPRRDAGTPALPWRLLVTRSIPRASGVLLTSASVPREALTFIAAMQPLEGLEAVAERLAQASFWSVRPSLTLRASRTRPGDAAVPIGTTRSAAASVDLKWRPRADWVLDATLNPDFSQVELDTPQLAGNTRFAISLIEKRPFFLESTDVLDLPLQAFYTRAVTDPRAGVRATWRGSAADATALAMRDDGGGLVLLPGAFATDAVTQDAVSEVSLLRARWHVRLGDAGGHEPAAATPARLTVGALLSTRRVQGGGGNEVAGLDALWRPHEGLRWRARVLHASTRASVLDAATPRLRSGRDQGSLYHLGLSHKEARWALNLEWQRTSAGFRNDNGFVEQAGVDRSMVEWIGRHGSVAFGPWRAHEFETFVWIEQRQALDDALAGVTAQAVTRRIHPGIWWTADRHIEAWVHAVADAERVRPGGRLHPVRGIAGQFGINPAPWFTRLIVEAQWGDRVDVEADRTGRGAVLTVDARWRTALPALGMGGLGGTRRAPPWGLEVHQRWQQGHVASPGGGRALTDTAWQMLAVLHLDERDSVRATAQAVLTERAPDASASLVAATRRSAVASLVAQRRLGVGRVVAVGWIRERQRTAREAVGATDTLREELFLKASFGW